MANIAILIGNSTYTSQHELACCVNDVEAMGALLEATTKFDKIRKLTNATSDQIRAVVREELESSSSIDKFYFYFSGHGVQIKSDFFYCGTEFDSARPNETGLSNAELHTLLRAYNPKLVVKVIDACNSGTMLIKADMPIITDGKGVLNDVIQIASCQSSQFSLAGTPLSLFTKHFCQAAFRKESGPVYYTDLINTIRDDFLGDDDQTPHFVSQGTGREKFADEATNLAKYRDEFAQKWEPPLASNAVASTANTTSQTMLQIIQEADGQFATETEANFFISHLFDGMIEKLKTGDFSEFYDVSVSEHNDYYEETAKSFIIRSLSSEVRPDNFVTASISRERRVPNYLATIASFAGNLGEEFVEKWNLKLNCSINRAQIKITLNPKFRFLNQLCLVVSCAPSLNSCYVFEISTMHIRNDWQSFDEKGSEINRNWYQRPWNEKNDWLIAGICDRLHVAIQKHVETTAQRLSATQKDGSAAE
jgi:hypothetical protein